MANNRMFLRCRTCGRGIVLAKCYSKRYYIPEEWKKDYIEDIEKFMEQHTYCTEDICKCNYLEPELKHENVDEENRFEIAYEIYREEEEEK